MDAETDIAISDTLMTVGWTYGAQDTALAVSMLDAAGILVFANGREMSAVAPHFAHAMGGVELRVPAAQIELAHTVLSDFQPIERRHSLWRAVLTVFLFVAVSVPPPASGFFLARLRPPPHGQRLVRAEIV